MLFINIDIDSLVGLLVDCAVACKVVSSVVPPSVLVVNALGHSLPVSLVVSCTKSKSYSPTELTDDERPISPGPESSESFDDSSQLLDDSESSDGVGVGPARQLKSSQHAVPTPMWLCH